MKLTNASPVLTLGRMFFYGYEVLDDSQVGSEGVVPLVGCIQSHIFENLVAFINLAEYFANVFVPICSHCHPVDELTAS